LKRDLPEIEERLREWAIHFKDRRRMERCRSIEHRYQRKAGDEEGWGDIEAAPIAPRVSVNVLRAIQTNEAIRQLPKMQAWSITYAYCYPHLPRGLVLRCLRKWIGKPVTWKVFIEQVEIGRFRVAAVLR
jgi:hypothetical protein